MKKLILPLALLVMLMVMLLTGLTAHSQTVNGSGISAPYDLLTNTVAVTNSTPYVQPNGGTNNFPWIPIKHGAGLTIFPHYAGAATSFTSNTIVTLALSDWTGTNWTTTGTPSSTNALNGTSEVRGFFVFTAAQLGAARKAAIGTITTTATNVTGIYVTNVTWAYTSAQ